jgi:hypothetical protein
VPVDGNEGLEGDSEGFMVLQRRDQLRSSAEDEIMAVDV